jgi:hypothetical protein
MDKLYGLNLAGMAHGLAEQREQPTAYGDLPFEDRLGLLVDREVTWIELRGESMRRAEPAKSSSIVTETSSDGR